MTRLYVETLGIAVLFGYMFFLLHIPLPWMLGPLAGVLFWNAAFKRKVCFPIGFRNAGLVVLGYLIGTSFTVETGKEIMRQLPAMVISTFLLVACSLLFGWLISKWTGMSVPTGIIGSVPGGLSQMAVLGEEVKGADATAVTFMQTIRLLTVIFVVPFLAFHGFPHGSIAEVKVNVSTVDLSVSNDLWDITIVAIVVLVTTWISIRLKLPTAFFLGPVIGTIILVLIRLQPPQLPGIWINLAQIGVGTYMGTTMNLSSLQGWKRLLPLSIIGSAGTVLVSMGTSYILFKWHSISLLTAFLSTAPGGMAEMGVTAAITGADVSIVTAYQMFRILFILFIVPPALKWLLIRRPIRSNPENHKSES